MKQKVILSALKAHLNRENIEDLAEVEISAEEWQEIFQKSAEQSVLSMVYEEICKTPVIQSCPVDIRTYYKKYMMKNVTSQIQRTAGFISLYKYLVECGIQPVIMKGLVCRNIFPIPDYRESMDEDIVVSKEQFMKCHEVLVAFGMKTDTDSHLLEMEEEVSYALPGRGLYIEVHKVYFPGQDEWNELMAGASKTIIKRTIEGTEIYAMNDDYHMLYLVLHAFKHFLHSGVGIRQVCDVMMYGQVYGKNINWNWVAEQCKIVRADYFFKALLCIAENHLGMHFENANIPKEWKLEKIDYQELLDDFLSGGVYGALDETRLHSGTLTMNYADTKKKSALLSTLLPSFEVMVAKYPYLREKRWLLPWAWMKRIICFVRKRNVVDAYKLGKERAELLRKYRIID